MDSAAGAAPWPGLPEDLWQRGRSARIGQRFVGDVAGVLADILAADARTAADAAVTAVSGDRFVATWDALRFLAARVELLESRRPPRSRSGRVAGFGARSERVGRRGRGLAAARTGRRSGDRGRSGRRFVGARRAPARAAVVGVEPRGASLAAWPPPVRRSTRPRRSSSTKWRPVWRGLPADSAAGVVLAGCVDRLDLAAQVGLVEDAVRVTRPGGTVVVLATDQEWWGEELAARRPRPGPGPAPPPRDLVDPAPTGRRLPTPSLASTRARALFTRWSPGWTVSGVHLFVPMLHRHDAVGEHTLALHRQLQASGTDSTIYTEIPDPLTADLTRNYLDYESEADPGDVLVYQFATESAIAGWLAGRPNRWSSTTTASPRRRSSALEQRDHPAAGRRPTRAGPAGAHAPPWAWPCRGSTSEELRGAGCPRPRSSRWPTCRFLRSSPTRLL